MEVGKLSVDQLMQQFSSILDKKLLNVATKDDLKIVAGEYNKIKEKVKELEFKTISVHNQLEYISQQFRRRNLVFRGLDISEEGDCKETITNFCTNMLGARQDICVSRAFVLKNIPGKLIVAEIASDEDRNYLLKKRVILKGTQYSIQQDMTPNIRRKHNKLLAMRKQIKRVNKSISHC